MRKTNTISRADSLSLRRKLFYVYLYIYVFIFRKIIREFMRLEMKSLKGIRFKNFNKSTGVPDTERSRNLSRLQSKRQRNCVRTFKQQVSIILKFKEVIFWCYNVTSNTMILNSGRMFYRDPLLKYMFVGIFMTVMNYNDDIYVGMLLQ